MIKQKQDAGPGDIPDAAFLPPLELRASPTDAWGLPWERQVGAATAWQAVVGERPATTGVAPPTMTTVVRLNTLLVSLRERLLSIENAAADVAIAEMALRHGRPESAGPDEDAPPLPQMHEAEAKRFAEIARDCLDLMAAAQLDLHALLGRGIAGRGGRAARETPRLLAERRTRNVTIDFADRRRAA